MKKLAILFFSVLLMNLQACQAPLLKTEEPLPILVDIPTEAPPPTVSPKTFSVPVEQTQIYNLFIRGMEYAALDKPQRKIACKQLKEEYRIQADWQTAWLLVYAINHDFTCISLNKSIELLDIIKLDPNTSTPLQWLNDNQINVFNLLKNTQAAKARLFNKLKKSQVKLKQENNKIEELKAIEFDVNKKLDNVESQLEQENNKIEALKDIEKDINKKLDE